MNTKEKVLNWMTQNNPVRVAYHSKAKKILLCDGDGPALVFPKGWHFDFEKNHLTNGILKIPMIKNPFNH